MRLHDALVPIARLTAVVSEGQDLDRSLTGGVVDDAVRKTTQQTATSAQEVWREPTWRGLDVFEGGQDLSAETGGQRRVALSIPVERREDL